MPIAVLFPWQEYEAIAERYASWQTRSQLRRAEDVTALVNYDPREPAREVVADVEESGALVVLDPLVIVEPDVGVKLHDQLRSDSVVIPRNRGTEEPLIYFCTVETLRNERRELRRVPEGRVVVTAETVSVQRWQRPEPADLLPFVPAEARSVLHVGCGDGGLGARIKEQQRCRVVGVEIDRNAASAAKRRLDDVYTGDIGEVVGILHEKFDCIVTSGVLENILDPWSLLADLRRLASAGGVFVAAIPNVANAEVIAGLRQGWFPTGEQVRFFTAQSIADLIDIAGWTLQRIDPAGATQFIAVARNGRT